MTARELGLSGFFLGVFFRPLLFFCRDGFWRRLVGLKAFFNAAIDGLPDFVWVDVDDFLGGVHAPSQALGVGVNQFDSDRAFVGGVGVHGDVLDGPVASPVGAVYAPTGTVTHPGHALRFDPITHN